MFVNNRKARTGERVEVAIYGEPGVYVGLSGIDRAFYTMQAGNELSYAKVGFIKSKEIENQVFPNLCLNKLLFSLLALESASKILP